jgi:ADP-ribose pyrophosphatase YjhB (NUDIX family)
MRRALLLIWKWLPAWLQRLAAAILRPRYQVAVGAVVINDRGQLLLGHHTYRRRYPWGLPGGDLKPGEDPLDAIRRELFEETGLSPHGLRLLFADNSEEVHHVTLIYLCERVSGDFRPSDEVDQIRYFDLDRLPEFYADQRVTLRRTLEVLKRMGTGNDHELA